MPSTINGIGTHYYGSWNKNSRLGVCRHCHREARLDSYDTRLWFVILFIPIFPLGRKRISDQCPLCTWHYAASADEWEMARQLNVSGALETYRSEPTSDNAAALHAQYLSYHQHEDAEAFRKEALEQFPNDATLHAALGYHLEHVGRWADASPLFERALELRPDVPDIRESVAQRRLFENKLDEARELLSHLDKPGAGQLYSLEPLDQLAGSYQKAGRHEEALQICQRLLDELPTAGQFVQFRKFVQTSEKALGRTETILPPREFSLRSLLNTKDPRYGSGIRWAVGLSIVALFVIAGMAASNEVIRRNRTVQVLNPFDEPVQIAFDGKPPVTVMSRRIPVSLPEGRHHASVSGPIKEEIDFDLSSGYFQRFTHSPLWVLNVDKQAVLREDTVYYAQQPRPTTSRFETGKSFSYFPHVDYPFTTPPQSLKVDSKSSGVQKIHVEVAQAAPQQVYFALREVVPDSARRYLETSLRRSPNDVLLLDAYVDDAHAQKREAAAREFLKKSLSKRPVEIAWHRAYQELSRKPLEPLLKEYDDLLSKEPKNAALLYLKGRIVPDAAQSQALFEQSREADPSLSWPWYALGYNAATRADWNAARPQLDKARELGMPADQFANVMHLVRLGQGEAAAMENDYRQQVMNNPQAITSLFYLLDVLAAQGKKDDMINAVNSWEKQIRLMDAQSATIAAEIAQGTLAIVMNDLKDLERLSRSSTPVIGPINQLRYRLLTGKSKEVATDSASEALFKSNGMELLVTAIALSLDGEAELAKTFVERVCQSVEELGDDGQRAAAILRSDRAPTPAEIDSVSIQPDSKALWLVLCARQFPTVAADLNDLARKLNVSRLYPAPIIRRATER